MALSIHCGQNLSEWTGVVGPSDDAWLFSSESLLTPIRADNLWKRYFKPKLDTIGLGWANFQVLRRTHASLGHEAGVDPKVAADQRGHGIGVALDTYTKTGVTKRSEAAETLEVAVLAT